jgi:hypothetical protein
VKITFLPLSGRHYRSRFPGSCSCVSANPTPTQLAFVHWRGLSSICPANPSPPPRFLYLDINDLAADITLHPDNLSTACAIGTETAWCLRLNVRSVTLLVMTCRGRLDGGPAHVFPSSPLSLVSFHLPVVRLFVSRARFYHSRASIETVQCFFRSPCRSSS